MRGTPAVRLKPWERELTELKAWERERPERRSRDTPPPNSSISKPKPMPMRPHLDCLESDGGVREDCLALGGALAHEAGSRGRGHVDHPATRGQQQREERGGDAVEPPGCWRRECEGSGKQVDMGGLRVNAPRSKNKIAALQTASSDVAVTNA